LDLSYYEIYLNENIQIELFVVPEDSIINFLLCQGEEPDIH